jgi:hypothetical protein
MAMIVQAFRRFEARNDAKAASTSCGASSRQ